MAAQKPERPTAPTTTISGSNVVIDWQAPDENGSPIYSYIIQIRRADGTSFATDSTDCDGNKAAIVSQTQCTVPISTLRAASFQLPWGASIHAKITAINLYGLSEESPVGNGAYILTAPDRPVNLAEFYASRSATTLGLVWTAGAANGGAPVLDYRITY